MAYSSDFRKKVLEIKKAEELTLEETASRFKIGIASLVRWKINPTPKKTRNKKATKLDMQALSEDVKNYPDLYQSERAKKLGVRQSTIHYALRRLKLSYKKNSPTP